MGAMGLTLVTGPANSAKAQLVLERYRAALAAQPDPRRAPRERTWSITAASWPTTARCSARAVEPFGGLMREIARRAGVAEIAIGEQARERLLEAVVAAAALELLAPRRRRRGSSPRSRASSPSSRRAGCRRRA